MASSPPLYLVTVWRETIGTAEAKGVPCAGNNDGQRKKRAMEAKWIKAMDCESSTATGRWRVALYMVGPQLLNAII